MYWPPPHPIEELQSQPGIISPQEIRPQAPPHMGICRWLLDSDLRPSLAGIHQPQMPLGENNV